jgi:hypothetical protein
VQAEDALCELAADVAPNDDGAVLL